MTTDASPFKTALSAGFGGLILGAVLAIAGAASAPEAGSAASITADAEPSPKAETVRRDDAKIRALKEEIAMYEERAATNRPAETASAEKPAEPMMRYRAKMPDGTETDVGVIEIGALDAYYERKKNDPAFVRKQRDLHDYVRTQKERALEARLGRLEGADRSAFTEEDETALADWLEFLPRQLELDAGRSVTSGLSEEERRANGELAFRTDEACRALQSQVGDAFVRSAMKRIGLDDASAALALETMRNLYEQTKR